MAQTVTVVSSIRSGNGNEKEVLGWSHCQVCGKINGARFSYHCPLWRRERRGFKRIKLLCVSGKIDVGGIWVTRMGWHFGMVWQCNTPVAILEHSFTQIVTKKKTLTLKLNCPCDSMGSWLNDFNYHWHKPVNKTRGTWTLRQTIQPQSIFAKPTFPSLTNSFYAYFFFKYIQKCLGVYLTLES